MQRDVSSRIVLDVTEPADLVFAIAVADQYAPSQEHFSATLDGESLDWHVVSDAHGSIEVENPYFLATTRSRVIVLPAWSPTHPSADVLKRLLSTRIYPDPRDVFVVQFRDVTKASIGARATQVASDNGHVVIRVEPGGSRYRVYVLDNSSEARAVRSVHGPYDARLR